MPFNEVRVSWPQSGHNCYPSACQTTVKYYGSIFGEPNTLAPTLTAVASQLWRTTRLATLAESTRFAPPFGRRSRKRRPLRASSRPLHTPQRGGILVVAARSGSPRSPTLAGSGRSSIESSRPVRARKFPRLCRLLCALRPLAVCRGHYPPRVGLGPLPPPPRPPSPPLALLAVRRGV